MTVKELIEKLQGLEQDKEIVVFDDGKNYPFLSISHVGRTDELVDDDMEYEMAYAIVI